MLRSFSALPTEDRVRALKARDVLWCALNLLLDDEEKLAGLCPTCLERAMEERCTACGVPLTQTEGCVNGGFDEARFAALKRGEVDDGCS